MSDDLVVRLNADPGNEETWTLLGEKMIAEGHLVGLRSLFNARHSSGRGGMDFAFALFQRMLTRKDMRTFYPIIEAYPADCPFAAAAQASLGYTNALLFRLDDAVRQIREAVRRMAILSATLPSEVLNAEELRKLAVNATLMEPSDWVPAARIAAPLLHLREESSFPDAEIACVAFADPIYFRHYARDFLAGLTAALGQDCLPLVGVINPDPGSQDQMDALRAEFPRVRFLVVDYPGAKIAEMAASARFVLANELLDRLARPTIFLDIDSGFRPATGEALRAIAEFPLAYQNRATLPPHLIVDACVVGAHPGDASRRFFGIAADYILGKMAEDLPLWMFDQVALHRAVSLAGIQMTDLCRTFRGRWEVDFPDFFKRDHTVSDGERFAARTNARFPRFNLTPDGGLVWLRDS